MSKKTRILIITTIIMLAVESMLLLTSLIRHNPPTTTPPNVTESETKTEEEFAEPQYHQQDLGNGWHELSAISHGYSIRYPVEFQADMGDSQVTLWEGNSVQLTIELYNLDGSRDLKQIAESQTNLGWGKLITPNREIEINGLHGYTFEYVAWVYLVHLPFDLA